MVAEALGELCYAYAVFDLFGDATKSRREPLPAYGPPAALSSYIGKNHPVPGERRRGPISS